MSHNKLAVIIGAAILLYGCATPGLNEYNSGNYAAACPAFEAEANRGDVAGIHNLGLCYERGLGGYPLDKERAFALWTLAARKGSAVSQKALAMYGRPVPQADLANRGSSFDPAAAALGLQLMQMGQPRRLGPPTPPPQQIDCYSYRSGNNVYTRCN